MVTGEPGTFLAAANVAPIGEGENSDEKRRFFACRPWKDPWWAAVAVRHSLSA